MSAKHFVVLGLCTCLFLGISGIANATKMKNPVVKKEISRKPAKFLTFIERVLSEHPTILSAQMDIENAKARVEGSKKLLYNPGLEIEAENVAKDSNYTIGITRTTDWYDKQLMRHDEDALLLPLASANLVLVKEQVAGEILMVIARYLSDQDLNALAKNRVLLINRFVGLVKRRKVAGEVGQSEVGMAELLLTKAIIQHAEFSSNLIEALGDFKALTGVGVDPSAPFPSELPKSITNKIDIETLARQHPLFVAEQIKVKAAKGRIRVTSHQVAVKDEYQAENVYRRILGRIGATKGRYIVMSRAWRLWSQTGEKKLTTHLQNLEKQWETGEISTTQYFVQFQQTLDIQFSGAKLKGDVWRAWIEWLIATGSVTKWLANLK